MKPVLITAAIAAGMLFPLGVSATPVFLATDYQTDSHIQNTVWFTEASDFKSNASAWGLTAGTGNGEASWNRVQYGWPENSPWTQPFTVAYSKATGDLSLSTSGATSGQANYPISATGNDLILDVEAANGKWNNITVQNLVLSVLDDQGVAHTWSFANTLDAVQDASIKSDIGRERAYALISQIPYSLSNGFTLTGTLSVAWDGNNAPAEGNSHFKVYGASGGNYFDPVPEVSLGMVVVAGLGTLVGSRRRRT